MPSNFNITLQFSCLLTGAQVLSIIFYMRPYYRFKTFTTLEITFLTIQSIIPFALDTIDKICQLSMYHQN